MRHGKKYNHLGRKAAHRKSMLANMACSLIEHKRIKTTLAKAKALRVYIEPLITKSKNDTTHSRRIVFSYLKQKNAITELFGDIATRVSARPGGYTRILKLGNRLGDNAQMALIELVDYNEVYITDKPKRKKRRSRKKKVDIIENDINSITEDAPVTEKTEDAVVEEKTEDAVVEEKNEDAVVEEKTEDAPVSEKTEDAVVEEKAEDAPVAENIVNKNEGENPENKE